MSSRPNAYLTGGAPDQRMLDRYHGLPAKVDAARTRLKAITDELRKDDAQ